jgi:uncharacterized membrane protein
MQLLCLSGSDAYCLKNNGQKDPKQTSQIMLNSAHKEYFKLPLLAFLPDTSHTLPYFADSSRLPFVFPKLFAPY